MNGLAALAALASPSLAQCELQKLPPPGPTSSYGQTIDVHGDIVAVGAPARDKVHVFERGPTSWAHTVNFNPQGSWDKSFGAAVAVDGDRVVVGDPDYGDLVDYYGRIDVFERQAGVWVHRNNLAVIPLDRDHLGYDVDIDGDWVVGGTDADYEEVAWAFRLLPSGGYTKQIFYGSGSGESGFGLSVGVDGEWLAIADPYGPTYPPQHVGSVYLYRLISGTWVHQQNITASDAAPGFRFGSDLDIDDGRLIVGLGAGTGSNRAYVFELRGTSWMEMAVLEVPIGADGVCKVALQGDRAVMRTLGSAQGPGAAWLFEHVGTQWTLASKFSAADAPPGGNFPYAMAMSDEHAVVTAAGKTAWIFDLAGGGHNHNYCVANPNSTGQACTISYQGSTSVSRNDFHLESTGGIPGQFGLFFYGSAENFLPFGQGYLCIGGQLFRLDPPVQCDGSGRALRLLDFTAPPANAGAGAITAGSMKYFQFWYRDPAGGGAQFNLTDGLAVSFCP